MLRLYKSSAIEVSLAEYFDYFLFRKKMVEKKLALLTSFIMGALPINNTTP